MTYQNLNQGSRNYATIDEGLGHNDTIGIDLSSEEPDKDIEKADDVNHDFEGDARPK